MVYSSVNTVTDFLQCFWISFRMSFLDRFFLTMKIVLCVFLLIIVIIGGLSVAQVPLPLLLSPLFLGNFFLNL